MEKFTVTSLRELKYMDWVRFSTGVEICINTKLDKHIEEAYNLSDYFISVKFHNDGEIAVFVYDNEEEGTRNTKFTLETRNELIEFARQYLNYKVTSLGELKCRETVPLDTAVEVCIDTKLSKPIEELYNLSDYFISVMFHNDGEIAVFVYDNEQEGTTSIKFTLEVRDKLIEFAKNQL